MKKTHRILHLDFDGVVSTFKYLFAALAAQAFLTICAFFIATANHTDWDRVDRYMEAAINTVTQLPADNIVCNHVTTDDGYYEVYLLHEDADLDEELEYGVYLKEQNVTLADGKNYKIVIQNASYDYTVKEVLLSPFTNFEAALSSASKTYYSNMGSTMMTGYMIDFIIFVLIVGLYVVDGEYPFWIETVNEDETKRESVDSEDDEDERIETAKTESVSGTDDYKAYMSALENNLDTVINLCGKLPVDLQKSCKKSCVILGEISKFVDESDFNHGEARKLNTYYMTEYIRFINKYIRFSSCKNTEVFAESLKKLAKAIKCSEEIFNNILVEVTANEVLDASVDTKVFKQLAESQGMIQSDNAMLQKMSTS